MVSALAVLNVVAGLLVLAYPMLLLGMAFLFDAPGSEDSLLLKAIVYATAYYYPAAPAVGNLLFWSRRTEADIGTLGLYTAISYSGILLLLVLYGVLWSGRAAV